MEQQHQRWYDLEPTVSLAVSLLKNASQENRDECCDLIISYAKDYNISLPNDVFTNFNYVLKRWYDEDKKCSEALEYLHIAPFQTQREIAFKVIQFLEENESKVY